jgi:hypothetical protein
MAVLIDPFTTSVTDWQPAGPFLDAVRETIGCTQVDSIMIQKTRCAWVDNFGLLREGQRFFRFVDSPFRFAGKVIITGTDADGMPCDTGPVDLAEIARSIDWCTGLVVVFIREELQATETELGMWPRVVRYTDFNQPAPDLKNARPAAFDPAPGHVPVEAPDRHPEPPRAGNGANPPPPPVFTNTPEQGGVPPTSLWTVISDDETDSFVVHESSVATGAITGTELRFKQMSDVTAYFARVDGVRLDLDDDTPDTVVARFATARASKRRPGKVAP